jgi:hypothetical protein
VLAKQAFGSGFAFGICRNYKLPKPTCVGLAIRGAGQGKTRELIVGLLNGERAPTKTVTRADGRRIEILGGGGGNEGTAAWWSEGNDLIVSLVSASGADRMIEAFENDRPSALSHPLRAELARSENGFQPVGLAFFEMAALPKLPAEASIYGLDKIKHLDYRWGFQGDALMTVTRLAAPAPRSGIVALLDQPTFDVKSLPPLPSGIDGFTILSFDADRFYDTLTTMVAASDPQAREQVQAVEKAILDATGQRLREDILGHLGPNVVGFILPSKSKTPTDPLTGFITGWAHVPGIVIMADIDDSKAVVRALDGIVKALNAQFRSEVRKPDNGGPGPIPLELRALKAPEQGYWLAIPPSAGVFSSGFKPTLIVGKSHLVIATNPAAARQAIALESQKDKAVPTDLGRSIEGLPSGLTFLSVSNPRESLLPDLIVNLPQILTLSQSNNMNGLRFFLPAFPAPATPSGSAGGFTVKIDPDEIPEPDDIRAHLFPSTFALSSDGDGFRLVTREAFPTLNPASLAPVGLALAAPMIQSRLMVQRRMQITQNLKMIGLALHNYHDANGHFPGTASVDKDGKPLLSWRVALLPYLEQAPLFNEFKLDEPWDSPHNKPLLERMPAVFEMPSAKAEPGMTFYRGFSGPDAFFDPAMKAGVNMATITDGTSNTIGIVEAREAVPWTQPDNEIPFDSKNRTESVAKGALGGHNSNGFNALLLDGSVRFLKDSLNPMTLNALITRSGGEVISTDAF